MRILTWFCVVCLAFARAIGAAAETPAGGAAAKPDAIKVTVNADWTRVASKHMVVAGAEPVRFTGSVGSVQSVLVTVALVKAPGLEPGSKETPTVRSSPHQP